MKNLLYAICLWCLTTTAYTNPPGKKPVVQPKAAIRTIQPIQWIPANNPIPHWHYQNRVLWQYHHLKTNQALNYQLLLQQQMYNQQLYLQWLRFWYGGF